RCRVRAADSVCRVEIVARFSVGEGCLPDGTLTTSPTTMRNDRKVAAIDLNRHGGKGHLCGWSAPMSSTPHLLSSPRSMRRGKPPQVQIILSFGIHLV